MSESSREQDLKQLHGMWEGRNTEELLAVWQQNDRDGWRDEVFEVIGQILSARLGAVPPQGEPAIHTPPKISRRAKWVALALALIVVSITAYLLIDRARYPVHVMRDEVQTITLTPSSNPKRLVYENDLVRISIGYDQFLAYIEDQLRDPETNNIQREGYQEWQAQVERDLRNSDTVKITDRNREYIVFAMLEKGQAAVMDKRSQSYTNTIQWRTYEFTCGPQCCAGYDYFYLPDWDIFNPHGTQFLEWQYMTC